MARRSIAVSIVGRRSITVPIVARRSITVWDLRGLVEVLEFKYWEV